MSSKENIASADSSSKKKKKDKQKKEKKDKKEEKKEKKEEKKEKKEKSSKKESKEAEKSPTTDSVEEKDFQEHEGGSPSPSQKKKGFGMFRFSGKKSKGDKKSSKQGSQESLKRDGESSPDSVRYEKRGSNISLEESTESNEPSIGSVESRGETEKRLPDLDEGFEIAKPESRSDVSEPPKKDDAIIGQVSLDASVPQPEPLKEEDVRRENKGPPDVIDEDTEVAKPESRNEVSEAPTKDDAVVDQVSLDASELLEEEDVPRENNEPPDAKEEPDRATETTALQEEDMVYRLETLNNEESTEECVHTEEQSPIPVVLSQKFEFEQETSFVFSESKEDFNNQNEEPGTTSAKDEEAQNLLEDEDVSEEPALFEESGTQASGGGDEIPVEDTSKELEKEVTSSEDGSVDTVVSAGFTNNEVQIDTIDETKPMDNETAEETKLLEDDKNADDFVGVEKSEDVEEPIVSIFNENKRDQMQGEDEEQPSVNEEAVVLAYTGKQEDTSKEETQEEPQVEEEPIMMTITERKVDELQEEVALVQEEPDVIGITEREGDQIKSETHNEDLAFVEREEDQTNSESQEGLAFVQREEDQIKSETRDDIAFVEEKPVAPTIIERDNVETVEEAPEEAPVNDEAMALSYPDKTENQTWNDGQEELQTEEEPVVLSYNKKQEDSIQLQIQEDQWKDDEENVTEPGKDNEMDQDNEDTSKYEAEDEVMTYNTKQEDSIQLQIQEDQWKDDKEKVTEPVKDNEIDQNNEETSKYEGEDEAMKGEDEPIPPKVRDESLFFDDQSQIKSSTPRLKTSSTGATDDQSQIKSSTPRLKTSSTGATDGEVASEAREEEQKISKVKPAAVFPVTAKYRPRSQIEYNRSVYIIRSIKDVKMSTKILLARLMEENKKLRALQQELREVTNSEMVQMEQESGETLHIII